MSTTTTTTWSSRKRNVFRSVFQTTVSQPTPNSTPSLRFPDHGQGFGELPGQQHPTHPLLTSSPLRPSHASPKAHVLGPTTGRARGRGDVVGDQVRWDRAWHVVTSRIQLPSSVTAEDSFGPLVRESQDNDTDFSDALRVLLHPAEYAPHASHTDDILHWHTHNVRQHFLQEVMPLLAACESHANPFQVLVGSVRTLEAAHRQYIYGLLLILRGMERGPAIAAKLRFRHDLHAIVGNSMSPALLASLRSVLQVLMMRALRIPKRELHDRTDSIEEEDSEETIERARRELLDLVESLFNVGLAGERFQVLFAELMDSTMDVFVKRSYASLWSLPQAAKVARFVELPTDGYVVRLGLSICKPDLTHWVENYYARLAVEVLGLLSREEDSSVGDSSSTIRATAPPTLTVAWADVEKWKDIAIGRLAALRINELFDIVLQWPHSKGGLEDLRTTVTATTPQRRLHLTDVFSDALRRRLLHPGSSTLRILQVYISMIRTFHALDSSKVLLDRVVGDLQLYLCQRDDAVRIVVTGLLADPEDATSESAASGQLAELAALLNEPAQSRRAIPDDEDLDWNDMEWIPAPADAAINYKRPRSEDVIGTLIGALGSQDIFIKEFQNIIAEKLLTQQTNFVPEDKVLRLLKRRFGENALQNCDVMVRDIQESRRVDAAIFRTLRCGPVGPNEDHVPILHSKILSRLFWPNLAKEMFSVPPPVEQIQAQYERGFEFLKSSRKLTWLDHLGTATVELTLEDREVEIECKTYQAAVIYAFGANDDTEGTAEPSRYSAEQLEESLQMDGDLIEEALSFWTNQGVLHPESDGSYSVIENKDSLAADVDPDPADLSPSKQAGPGTADAAQDHARRPRRALSAKDAAQRQIYWQFIVGMLTNAAVSMPLMQVAMMLRMLIPDGFPWTDEELQSFLADKVQDGDLEMLGGKYRLVKK